VAQSKGQDASNRQHKATKKQNKSALDVNASTTGDDTELHVPLAKKQKTIATEISASPGGEATSNAVVRKDDAMALRAELQLRIEDDPYGDCPAPVRRFEELSLLPQYVLSSLRRHGIAAPMPIQAQALPLVLSGRDVIGLAQTGSGKTLAFLLPAAVHLEKQLRSQRSAPAVPSPFVLVLAPTRELAVQIADEADKMVCRADADASKTQVHTVAVYGGGDKWAQEKKLRQGAHIVVATPGRLADFVDRHVLALDRVTYLVLDEADRMLDMGFQDDMATVAKQVQPKRQMLFFSATWGQEVQRLAQGLCRSGSKPVRISYGQDGNMLSSDGTPAKHKAREGITQEVIVLDHDGDDHFEKQEAEKDKLLDKFLQNVLKASDEHKVLVFVSQKQYADKLSERLQKQGHKADSMHGGKSQDYRLWVLDQFRKGELRLLVCTDVLGRGIDIPKVSHVVIHEMGETEDYIHRIGRTARGRYGKGHALVFFEYWDGYPQVAGELIEVLAASKQPIPSGLQKIADEVASGKRKSRAQAPAWKGSSSSGLKGGTWSKWGM
jgi:ATP-dependent RNA helicase DDX5/DBP2